MLVNITEDHLLSIWRHKGHTLGSCIAATDTDLMYVNIPKNASTWTKPHLVNLGWQSQNYHIDNLYHRHSIVVLRDPVERWLSGICEYFALYMPDINVDGFNKEFYELLLDQVAVDDHTEKQCYFVDGLDHQNVTWFWCDSTYADSIKHFLEKHNIDGKYNRQYQMNRTVDDVVRSNFKSVFAPLLSNTVYIDKIKSYYSEDYNLINSVKFYRIP